MAIQNKKLWVIGALVVAVFLAMAISPFACQDPDGLDSVAEKFEKEKEEAATTLPAATAAKEEKKSESEEAEGVWTHAPMADYKMPGIGEGEEEGFAAGFSTSLAGLVGTLGIFILASVFAWILRRTRAAKTA